MPDELHVIFGGGQVGQPLARLLAKRGLRVRIVKRSAGAPEGIELMQGDATDPEFLPGKPLMARPPSITA